MVAEGPFSRIKQIYNWLHYSILADLLRDLAIIALHGQTILFFKDRYMHCLYEFPPLQGHGL